MEDNLNIRQPQWKITSMEDNLNERQQNVTDHGHFICKILWEKLIIFYKRRIKICSPCLYWVSPPHSWTQMSCLLCNTPSPHTLLCHIHLSHSTSQPDSTSWLQLKSWRSSEAAASSSETFKRNDEKAGDKSKAFAHKLWLHKYQTL